MNLPQVYMCSPPWTLLPPPSPFHPSGSSQCTSPKHPVSCIKPGLATRFIHDILHVSMLYSQIFPPSPSPTESIRLFYTSVSLLLSRTQGYCYHLWIKHLQFESSVRPWTRIFICLGRTSEDKVTDCHANPPWNLELVFFLWHHLLKRTCPTGCQVNGAVSSFGGCSPILGVGSLRLWHSVCVLLAPSLQWLDLTCGLSHWPSPAPSGTVSGSKPTHWSPSRAALLATHLRRSGVESAHPAWSTCSCFSIIHAERVVWSHRLSASSALSTSNWWLNLSGSHPTCTLRLPIIQAHIRSWPKAKWNVPVMC